jgi:hypothetical protein
MLAFGMVLTAKVEKVNIAALQTSNTDHVHRDDTWVVLKVVCRRGICNIFTRELMSYSSFRAFDNTPDFYPPAVFVRDSIRSRTGAPAPIRQPGYCGQYSCDYRLYDSPYEKEVRCVVQQGSERPARAQYVEGHEEESQEEHRRYHRLLTLVGLRARGEHDGEGEYDY